jgi:hypothetical protein
MRPIIFLFVAAASSAVIDPKMMKNLLQIFTVGSEVSVPPTVQNGIVKLLENPMGQTVAGMTADLLKAHKGA